MKPNLLNALPWNLICSRHYRKTICWRHRHESQSVEGIVVKPHLLKASPWNLICWRHRHKISPVEGIATKMHL
jgi:hypothetical protein